MCSVTIPGASHSMPQYDVCCMDVTHLLCKITTNLLLPYTLFLWHYRWQLHLCYNCMLPTLQFVLPLRWPLLYWLCLCSWSGALLGDKLQTFPLPNFSVLQLQQHANLPVVSYSIVLLYIQDVSLGYYGSIIQALNKAIALLFCVCCTVYITTIFTIMGPGHLWFLFFFL